VRQAVGALTRPETKEVFSIGKCFIPNKKILQWQPFINFNGFVQLHLLPGYNVIGATTVFATSNNKATVRITPSNDNNSKATLR
jgi:hypothetical protein